MLHYSIEDATKERRRKCSVSVTLIDAQHMIGSVMLLFRESAKNTLYTGDFRYDVPSSLVDTLISLKCPRIHSLIVDNTYSCLHQFYDFPSRTAVWLALKQCMALYPHDTVFYVALDNLGKEEPLLEWRVFFNRPFLFLHVRNVGGCCVTRMTK